MKSDIRALCLLIMLLAPMAVTAESRAILSASINPVTQRARSIAPVGVEVTLQWSGTGILEGSLELTLRDGNEVLSQLRSGDMALTGGSQTFRMMLPPPRSSGPNNKTTLSAKFAGKQASFDLGYFPMSLSSYNQRNATIGVSTPRAGYRPATYGPRTLQSLRFETFDPDRSQPDMQGVTTTVSYFNTEDLPVNPLGYCQFDMVFAGEEGFTALKEKQLDALARWVEGGGSVLVVPRGKLQDHHLAFLNRLAGASGQPVGASELTADGNVSVADRDVAQMRNQVGMFRSGLGRAVIALDLPTDHDLNMQSWRQVTLFLWKFTGEQSGRILNKGTWTVTDVAQGRNFGYRYTGAGQIWPLAGGAELLQSLMPQSTRMIPFTVILLVLGGFVLVIGPLDYFGLGLFRARRFTWVLFPAMSVVFTVSTMQLAAFYMGRSDHRNKVTMIDVGAGGRVLRQNTVDVTFAAREKAARTEVKNALVSIVNRSELSASANPRLHYMQSDQWSVGDDGLGQYVGQYPIQYTMEQTVRQWSPVGMRSVSFEPVADMPPLNWDAVAPLIKASGNPEFGKIKGVLGTVGRDCAVYYQRLSGFVTLQAGSGSAFPQVALQNLSARPAAGGLFALVAQVSPTGGDTLEDVAVLDATDPQQLLLIVVEKKGNDYMIYRRLYEDHH